MEMIKKIEKKRKTTNNGIELNRILMIVEYFCKKNYLSESKVKMLKNKLKMNF